MHHALSNDIIAASLIKTHLSSWCGLKLSDVIVVRRKYKFGNKTLGLKFQVSWWVWKHVGAEDLPPKKNSELGQCIMAEVEYWLVWALSSRMIEQVAFFTLCIYVSKIRLHSVPILQARWL